MVLLAACEAGDLIELRTRSASALRAGRRIPSRRLRSGSVSPAPPLIARTGCARAFGRSWSATATRASPGHATYRFGHPTEQMPEELR